MTIVSGGGEDGLGRGVSISRGVVLGEDEAALLLFHSLSGLQQTFVKVLIVENETGNRRLDPSCEGSLILLWGVVLLIDYIC